MTKEQRTSAPANDQDHTFFSRVNVPAESAALFADLHPALDRQAAVPEANRCLFCFDAPCSTACPTHIDVPRFIRKIASGNVSGAAYTILDANILGGSCARACPVEVLCEGSCVLHHYNEQPIQIGRLQRYAVDALYASGAPLPFAPGEDTGFSVALIGAGPASLACAAELRRRGIQASVYDARPLPGGLNTYGIAEYKLPLLESLREIDMLSQLGVTYHFNTQVDAELLAQLEATHDAVFLGLGLGSIHKLGLAGEHSPYVTSALDLIEGYKSNRITSAPARVVVIGAGNTAIDAAIACLRLGATDVRIVYRRGSEQMSAFTFEYEHARREGVEFLWFVQPISIRQDGPAAFLEMTRLAVTEEGSILPIPGSTFSIAADLIVLAIGQDTHTGFLGEAKPSQKIELEQGRIMIDGATGQTSNAKYFAGGDCTNGGREVVDAVADGKRAGLGIAAWLGGFHASA